MRCFDETWSHSSGETQIDLEGRSAVTVQASGSNEVQVHGLRDGAPVLLFSGRTFKKHFTLENFDQVALTSSAPFGYSCTIKARPRYEPMNDLDPPAPPIRPTNLLDQIRQSVLGMKPEAPRRSTMESELEEYQDRYAVDDDDFRFEEEIAEEAAASSQPDPEPPVGETPPPTTSAGGTTVPVSPPQAPDPDEEGET